jgi:hypothetical protein
MHVCVGARERDCDCVRVALFIQHATRMRHIACGLRLHHICRHYLISGTIFVEKVTEYEMRVLIFSTTWI